MAGYVFGYLKSCFGSSEMDAFLLESNLSCDNSALRTNGGFVPPVMYNPDGVYTSYSSCVMNSSSLHHSLVLLKSSRRAD